MNIMYKAPTSDAYQTAVSSRPPKFHDLTEKVMSLLISDTHKWTPNFSSHDYEHDIILPKHNNIILPKHNIILPKHDFICLNII